MINLMGKYKIIKGKSNFSFIITPETIYIQTPKQAVKLIWPDKKRVADLRRITLLIDCGIISSYDDLFYQIKKTELKLEATRMNAWQL